MNNQQLAFEKLSKLKVGGIKMEVWKDIKDYEGLYQVSNLGRIKSLERNNNQGKGNYHRNEKIRKLKIMKGTNGNKTNYYVVALSKNGKLKKFFVHRLVAIAFIDNPNNKPYINHKDGNGLNNSVDNLEWCTNQENQLYSLYTIKTTKNTKSVIAYDKRTEEKVIEFSSIGLASKWLLNSHRTNDLTCETGIVKCCKKKIPSYLGYIWRYKENE